MDRRDQVFRDQPSLFDCFEQSGGSPAVKEDVADAGETRVVRRRARKLVRRSHPRTSRWAAEDKVRTTLESDRARALRLVRSFPGNTAAELDDLAGDDQEGKIRRRLAELAELEFVKRSDDRVCTVGGKRCQTWIPVEVQSVSDLPDAITNPVTPKDQHGDPIADGVTYRIIRPRAKPVRVIVREDPDNSDLLCLPIKGERWQRIDQMDPDLTWERVEDEDDA